MSAKVEILVNRLEDVVYIPVQAVSPGNGKQVCHIARGFGSERREIEVGEFNDEFIEVKGGLAEGERVLLRQPESLGTEGIGKEPSPQDKKKPTPAEPVAASPKAAKA